MELWNYTHGMSKKRKCVFVVWCWGQTYCVMDDRLCLHTCWRLKWKLAKKQQRKHKGRFSEETTGKRARERERERERWLTFTGRCHLYGNCYTLVKFDHTWIVFLSFSLTTTVHILPHSAPDLEQMAPLPSPLAPLETMPIQWGAFFLKLASFCLGGNSACYSIWIRTFLTVPVDKNQSMLLWLWLLL